MAPCSLVPSLFFTHSAKNRLGTRLGSLPTPCGDIIECNVRIAHAKRCRTGSRHIAFSAIRLELSKLRVAPSQVTKMWLRTPDPLYTHMWRLQWDYFGRHFNWLHCAWFSFAKAVFSANDLCMPEFSILVKRLHNNFGHNTDYVILSGVLFCCMPSCSCFVWLAEGQVSGIMWSSETVPKDAHTKFVPVLKIFRPLSICCRKCFKRLISYISKCTKIFQHQKFPKLQYICIKLWNTFHEQNWIDKKDTEVTSSNLVISPHLYMQDILQATCLRMAKYLQGIYVSGKLLQKWTRVGGGRGRSKLLQVATPLLVCLFLTVGSCSTRYYWMS